MTKPLLKCLNFISFFFFYKYDIIKKKLDFLNIKHKNRALYIFLLPSFFLKKSTKI